MKLTLNLDFEIPIWRFFFGDVPRLPYEFSYKNKIYRNAITIIQFAYDTKYFIDEIKEKIYLYQNPILCVPDIEQYNNLKKHMPSSCRIILAGHNSFIDENIYNIINIEKKYDLVINSCFEYYKRRYLTNNLENVLHIGYYQCSTEEFVPKNGFCPNFMNKERKKENFNYLDHDSIIEYYNSSKVGGIFSETEGSCFSSGEYLLCGLPVISTKCSGGRQHWYNNDNSIICEPNEISIKNALDNAIIKLENRTFNPNKIRQMHIDEMEIQRNNLVNEVIDIYTKISTNKIDFNELKESLKHYHSNINLGCKYGIKQQTESLLAEQIINK